MIKNVMLVCLVSGTKKNGNGNWFKAQFKGHTVDGKPVTADYFLSNEVGEKMVKEGLIEDVMVNVSFDFDDFLRPTIVSVVKATTATQNKAVDKL